MSDQDEMNRRAEKWFSMMWILGFGLVLAAAATIYIICMSAAIVLGGNNSEPKGIESELCPRNPAK